MCMYTKFSRMFQYKANHVVQKWCRPWRMSPKKLLIWLPSPNHFSCPKLPFPYIFGLPHRLYNEHYSKETTAATSPKATSFKEKNAFRPPHYSRRGRGGGFEVCHRSLEINTCFRLLAQQRISGELSVVKRVAQSILPESGTFFSCAILSLKRTSSKWILNKGAGWTELPARTAISSCAEMNGIKQPQLHYL